MVPVRTEYGAEFGTYTTTSPERDAVRPQLILQDTSAEVSQARQRSASRKRQIGHRLESVLLALSITGALLFLIVTSAGSVWSHAVAAYSQTHNTARPVVTVHVGKGDTLWHYASRYGDPNSYILDRVQSIASENNLSSSASLNPGQTLHITVQNPVVIAELDRASHSRLASRVSR